MAVCDGSQNSLSVILGKGKAKVGARAAGLFSRLATRPISPSQMSIVPIASAARSFLILHPARSGAAFLGVRQLHSSRPRSLPRAPPRRGQTLESHSPLRESPDARLDEAQAVASGDDLPWFLQDQAAVELDRPKTARSRPTPPDQRLAPTLKADPSLPQPLQILHTHIALGPVAGLLHQPSFLDNDHDDDSQHGSGTSAGAPLHFIPARTLAGSTSWCDWVVIVTVRENNGGQANARVAEEVAEILRRVGPPSEDAAAGTTMDLDDLLGPGASLSGAKDPYGPASRSERATLSRGQTIQEKDDQVEAAPQAAWALHRNALREKFSDSDLGTSQWRPNKVLSRETQSGLRLLHATDPEKWTVSTLSRQFKISPEAVRRILRSNPERWGGDNKEAGQGSRAASSLSSWQREDAEIERLRALVDRDQAAGAESDLAGSPDRAEVKSPPEDEATLPYAGSLGAAPMDVRSLGKPRHPVRLEGLPAPSSAASRRRSSRARAKNAAAAEGEGQAAGEWVLVDAGWCIVHVMTPKARTRYDVEGVWKDIEDGRDGDVAAI
ncbi:unnamed protein product [Parajaminaea phylloscopi]